MGRSRMRSCIVAFTLCGLLGITASQEVFAVGGGLGWSIPLGGPVVYQAWALFHIFHVGDTLLFNFKNGEQDVARVTKEAFALCDTTNPIAVKTSNPSNFTLDGVGDFFFTSTLNRHCDLGQKLAIHVFGPGLLPRIPTPPGPLKYIVGGPLGWIVPPGGQIVYDAWASLWNFKIGDTLVFWFIDGLQDVAVVSKEAFDKCNTSNTIAVYTSSPTRIVLNTTGEHYYTSTYKLHCDLGQKLVFNVTSSSSSSSGPASGSGSGSALPPSVATVSPSTLAPATSASKVLSRYVATSFFIAMTVFFF